MSDHVSLQRREQARARIERKIAILERYLNEGVPEGGFAPRNLTEFRRWEDTTVNVTRIGSPNTLDKPHNLQLKVRAQELITMIARKAVRKKTRLNEGEALRAALRDKDRLIADLTNQWHVSEHERIRAQQDTNRLKNRLAELIRDNGDLTKKLNSIIPLRPAI